MVRVVHSIGSPTRVAGPNRALSAAGTDAALFWLWLLAVALAPVWFGSNTALVWGAHAAIFGFLLAAYGATRLVNEEAPAVPMSRLAVPLIAVAAAMGWASLQTVAWMPASWQHPIWDAVASVLGRGVPGAISVYPEAGWRAILWIATTTTAMFLGVQFGRNPGRAGVIVFFLAIVGGLIASYGLVVYFTGNKWVLWLPKHAYLNALTATFVNRNTFAAYAGISIVAALGLLLDGIARGRGAAMAAANAGRAAREAIKLVLLGVIIVALAAALILTGSRAGLAVTVLGIVVVSTLQLARRRRVRIVTLTALLLVLVSAAAFSSKLGDLLTSRLSTTTDVTFAERLAVDARALHAIEDRPLLGHGLGAFEQAFPMFPDVNTVPHNRWEYAHNDWLEALMTLGIPAGLTLWLVFGWILARCLSGALRQNENSVYCAIGAGVCVLAMAHSLIDFSVQIQGFALPLMAMLGVGVAQSWQDQAEINLAPTIAVG